MKAEIIAKALGGRKAGAAWMARCPAHDDRDPSLSIQDANGKVLVRCHAGCDQARVIAKLRSRGLWEDNSHRQRDFIRQQPRLSANDQPDRDDGKRTESALTIWQATTPAGNTLVESYLVSRGLRLPPPPTLRFHAGLKHPSGGIWPAMVALVTRGADDAPIAIHRTFLARDGVGKAPVDPAKMMLGPCRGGVVRLAEPGEVLMVGEGTRLGDTLGRRGVADVTLIDKSRTHLWKPLLHEVAAGSMDFAVQEMEFRAQAHWHHFHYRIGELIGLDRNKREVELAPYLDAEGDEVMGRRLFRYDTLIIAIGSQGNDFGTPGVREHAIMLDTTHDANRFHERLLNSFLRARVQSELLKPEQMNVAIIGAGATGTELAAELRSATRQLAAYGYERIDPDKDITIDLIEAADRILPPLPKRLADEALKILKDLRVRVHTSARVEEVTASGVRLANGTFIPAELIVWAAGVKAPDILTKLDELETNRASQLVVLRTLQTSRDPNIFAIGDCAACSWAGHPGKTVPPRAQAAHQQALHLARQLKRLLAGREVEPWRYRDFGSLVSLGDYSTVGKLMGGVWVEGLIARVMYLSLYKMHEIALHGVPTVLLDTLASTITRRSEPHVKLH